MELHFGKINWLKTATKYTTRAYFSWNTICMMYLYINVLFNYKNTDLVLKSLLCNDIFIWTLYSKFQMAMLVCWMIWYCYSFQLGLKSIFQVYSSGFSISWYGSRYHVTLYTVYRTGFCVCIILVFCALKCSFSNSFIEFYFIVIVVTIVVILWPLFSFWTTCFRPWTFPLNVKLNMLPSDSFVSCLHLFSTRIFYKWVPGFATDYPCGVWCRGLTTCLLYVGPPVGNLVWNDCGFVSLT